MNIFSSNESMVRSYCRAFPATFEGAEGSYLWAADGDRYLDFLCGCGSLNYGHNHPVLKDDLLQYISGDGICMSMDMHTAAKQKFLSIFQQYILNPRELDYRVQFPGPTGANAIEAAIKLARKVTGRRNVIAFTNGFHGCSLGALALTGSGYHRKCSVDLLTHVTRMPYDRYLGNEVDTAEMLARLLEDPSSGVDKPAAIVLEVVQGEGGLNCASKVWLQEIQRTAQQHGALLIVDDIQAGVGRTGSFFSFEPFAVQPDIVCLAKAISGYGLPMSLTLLKPEFDIWSPGEHNGTFRGNNLAFVTGAAAISHFWADNKLMQQVATTAARIRAFYSAYSGNNGYSIKGRGLMTGLEFADSETAKRVQHSCFENKLIVELCGPHDSVLKPLPALTATDEEIESGLEIIAAAIEKHA